MSDIYKDGCLNCIKREHCESFKEIGKLNYKFLCYEKDYGDNGYT